jgi:hypothetical protein
MAQVPELPSSLAPTMMAVQALALALVYVAPQVRAAAGAQKSAERLRTSLVRGLGEFQLLVEGAEQTKRIVDVLSDESISHLDRIAEARTMTHALAGNYRRAMQVSGEIKAALDAARKYDQVLAFALPGWRAQVANLDRSFGELDAQLLADPLEPKLESTIAIVESLFAQAHALTAAGELPLHQREHEESVAVASEGYASWFSSLPADDWSDAVDSAVESPLRWVEGQGWVAA